MIKSLFYGFYFLFIQFLFKFIFGFLIIAIIGNKCWSTILNYLKLFSIQLLILNHFKFCQFIFIIKYKHTNIPWVINMKFIVYFFYWLDIMMMFLICTRFLTYNWISNISKLTCHNKFIINIVKCRWFQLLFLKIYMLIQIIHHLFLQLYFISWLLKLHHLQRLHLIKCIFKVNVSYLCFIFVII